MLSFIKRLFNSTYHECKFDGEEVTIHGHRFKKCTHPGCTIVDPVDDVETHEQFMRRLKEKYPNSVLFKEDKQA